MQPIRFCLFGALRVRRGDEELALGAKQQRLLLALLLARPGEWVGFSELVDVLWADEPPRSAANVIYRYVGSLRRMLEPDLPRRSEGSWLHSDAGSYLMRVDAQSLDLLGFRDRVARSRNAAESGSVEEALDGLVAALDLWRDGCANGLGSALQNHPAFVALENERTQVVHEAVQLAMRTRKPWLVLPALRRAADRNPLDEALQAQLMVVLAADGKQAESIMRYQQVRALLADELGIDAGAELTAALRTVLRGDGGWDERMAASVTRRAGPAQDGWIPAARALPRPAQLPNDHAHFAGRQVEVERLVSQARRQGAAVPVLGIDGIPGMGKTTLAVHVAHILSDHYPDGQLYIDLRGFDAHRQPVHPKEALRGFLSALGVAPTPGCESTDALTAQYRTAVADRRILVLLDNADDADQIRPLLPGASTCLVLVTSRSRLVSLATSAGAHLLTLNEPDRLQAREMFAARMGRDGTEAETAALDAVIEYCGRLPLAMALVNARAADHPLPEVLAELQREWRSLAAFADENLDNDLRAIFSWSYRRLTPDAARLFRLLSLHPGPSITPESAAALSGTSDADVRALLGELMRTRLATQHRLSRYQLHILVQAYSAELTAQLDSDDAIDAARRRLHTFYLRTAQRAQALVDNGKQAEDAPERGAKGSPVRPFTLGSAMEWFVAEYDVLRAIAEDSAARGETRSACKLVLALQDFHKRHGWWHRWRDVARLSRDAAVEAGDEESGAHLERSLAGALHFLDDNAGALAELRSAKRRFEKLGLESERAQVLTNITRVMLAMGDYDEALTHHEAVISVLRRYGTCRVEANSLAVLGHFLAASRPQEAEQFTRRAVALYESLNDSQGLASCDEILARIALREGRLTAALRHHQLGVQRLRGSHNRLEVAELMITLSDIRVAYGQMGEARDALREAADIFDDSGSPLVARVRTKLNDLVLEGADVGDGRHNV